ncbi:hypothetical protein ACIQUL_34235 [Streptomyces sp. NPDC090303]|uniref:hypothetical protein n=1 Tax=Streptomyces sp. NPDC090303 TaxID=3365960 RepID=UPI00382455FA
MLYSIDSIVGPFRAAELVNLYRERLRSEDMLPDHAALATACIAFAYANIYSLAAAGQVWQAYEKDGDGRDRRIEIVEMFHDGRAGHCATARTQSGILEVLPLDQLDSEYFLYSWLDARPDESA